jgi:hypothetical protein
MPAPITSQKKIGVASAPITRLRCRTKRTTSRRHSDKAGRSREGLERSVWAR